MNLRVLDGCVSDLTRCTPAANVRVEANDGVSPTIHLPADAILLQSTLLYSS